MLRSSPIKRQFGGGFHRLCSQPAQAAPIVVPPSHTRITMRFHADLHVHSKYSRATSRDLDLEHLAYWAARKGIGVVGTGDFCHPAWAAELKDKLVPAEPGLFRLRDDIEKGVAATLPASCRTPVRFMLEVEISTIYKKGDKTRKVHHLIYAPDFATMDRIAERLGRIGNIKSDGRPILGLDSRDLLEITLESGPGAYLVPAHIWTPWFAALGSQSGFDSIAECYGDLSDAHLRGRDRAVVRSADELARLVPRPLSAHLELRRAFARQARARGDRIRLRHGLLRAAPRAGDRRRLCRHGRVLPRGGKVSSRRPSQMRGAPHAEGDAGRTAGAVRCAARR